MDEREAPTVSVTTAVPWWFSQVDGHVQRPDGKIAFHAIGYSPTNHTLRINVDDHSQMQPILARPVIANVRGSAGYVCTKYEPPRVYRRVKLSKDGPYDREEENPDLQCRIP